ncbi:MAG: crotonase/enoyl-CoA hydratase family protein [candidate division NC10 bacterium]|jgi:enoyl-CoA hydratase|nr:crotonase/enoyl-CoA hydratase family protein [candidate division NC10 bacterium]
MEHSAGMNPVLTAVHDTPGGKIFQIIINRPEVHNCVNGQAARLLLEAWQRFKSDDALTVAILHGAGDRAFCSGADLTDANTLVDPSWGDREVEDFVRNGTGPMGGTRIIQHKPVITMSQGYTYAGGLELFCHGHLRIAEEGATFSVACRRWGVPLADGGTVLLPRLLGLAQALPLIITGQRIDARRAFDIGLVWEVTPRGQGLERAFSCARQICAQPRDALLADLSSVLEGAHLSLEKAFELEARGIVPVCRSESLREGVARFLSGNRNWFE